MDAMPEVGETDVVGKPMATGMSMGLSTLTIMLSRSVACQGAVALNWLADYSVSVVAPEARKVLTEPPASIKEAEVPAAGINGVALAHEPAE